eukprot:355894-Chlamydomonas_euryale.AAC.1
MQICVKVAIGGARAAEMDTPSGVSGRRRKRLRRKRMQSAVPFAAVPSLAIHYQAPVSCWLAFKLDTWTSTSLANRLDTQTPPTHVPCKQA